MPSETDRKQENKKQALITKHLEYQENGDYWSMLLSMAEGGKKLTELQRYELLIPPFERDPGSLKYRLRVARYENILGGLIAILRAQIMASPTSFEPNSDDPFWQEEFLVKGCFVNGYNVSFRQMLSVACFYALSQEMCYCVVEVDPESSKPFINLVTRNALLDWNVDKGRLSFGKMINQRLSKPEWDDKPILEYEFIIYQLDKNSGKYYGQVIVLQKTLERESNSHFTFPATPSELQSFTLVEKTAPQEMYSITVNGELIAPSPIVPLTFPSPLWIGDRLYDSQKSHFNQINGVEWGLLSTNFALLVFLGVDDPEVIKDRFRQAGDGYYLDLPQGVEPSWLERGTEGIQLGIDYADKVKQSMFDAISLLAAANTPTAIRRSGESKVEDRRNLQILLETYGMLMKDFATVVLDTVSVAYGEEPGWTVKGFEGYNVDQLLKDIEEYRQSEEILRSPTFSVEGQKAIALKASEAIGIPRKYWQEILDEIDVGASMLSDKQLETLTQLTLARMIPLEVALQTLVDAQALPPTFPVQESLIRLGLGVNAPLDLAQPEIEGE